MSKIENANVQDLLENTAVISQVETSTIRPTQVTTPVVPTPDIVHADIYFEVGQKGLPEEGKAQLTARANMLKQHEDYGVLVQSYLDQQWLEQAI